MKPHRITISLPDRLHAFVVAQSLQNEEGVNEFLRRVLRERPEFSAYLKSTTVGITNDQPKPPRPRQLTHGQISKLHLYHTADNKSSDRTWEQFHEDMKFELSQRWCTEEEFSDRMLTAKLRRDELYARAPLEQKPFIAGYDDRCDHGMMYPEEDCYECDVATGAYDPSAPKLPNPSTPVDHPTEELP